MQLFASDNTGVVPAAQAEKHRNYRCPECGLAVRLRGGPHRQPHYYHLRRTSDCRQHQKSAEHLQAQLKLLQLLPEGECSLERPFPSIGRIADTVWETANIVFEVQCSPISKEEVEARTADYRSIGLEIVWILHEKRFNKKNLTAAESHLRAQTCYYTNMSPSGQGTFYDQFEVVHGARRLFKGTKLPLAIHRPIPRSSWPSSLNQRYATWTLSFSGDLLDRLKSSKDIAHLAAIEKSFEPKPGPQFMLTLPVKRIYSLALDGLIRLVSKN